MPVTRVGVHVGRRRQVLLSRHRRGFKRILPLWGFCTACFYFLTDCRDATICYNGKLSACLAPAVIILVYFLFGVLERRTEKLESPRSQSNADGGLDPHIGIEALRNTSNRSSWSVDLAKELEQEELVLAAQVKELQLRGYDDAAEALLRVAQIVRDRRIRSKVTL